MLKAVFAASLSEGVLFGIWYRGYGCWFSELFGGSGRL